MTKTTNRYWRTGNIYLAAFLFSKGAIVVGISAGERHIAFTFKYSAGLYKCLEDFRGGRPRVDVRIYVCAIETLRSKAMDVLMEHHGEDR